MNLRAHSKALTWGIFFSFMAVLVSTSAGHAGGVDKDTIGTWELAVNGGRWLWEIDPNGTYEFHSEAPDGVAPHAGTFLANGGIWSLQATSGYADGGTYTFQPPDNLIITGHLGTATWHHLANAANDANTFGTWELSLNGGRWEWEIDPNGTYQFHSEAGDGVAPHAGTFSASDGYWWLQATSGYADGGTYTFQPPGTLITTGHLGTATWQRSVAGAMTDKQAEQMANSAFNGDGQALQRLTQAAQQGDAVAQDWLGRYFVDKKDDTQSVSWFQKAAAQGNADAEAAMGAAYHDGRGVPKDYAQSVSWFRKAALQGNADAESFLGDAYEFGKGVPRDYVQAVSWYRKAAAQGNGDAEDDLGNAYHDGKGVSQDYAQAVSWYRKGAAQGDADAEDDLGSAYHDGKGVSQDYGQAVSWYRKAAAQGNADADDNLANAYQDGKGVPKDATKAAYWLKKTAVDLAF